MRWSKLKSRVEKFFAPSVAGRVELRDTWYRSTGQFIGRGWMTLDGEEIGSFSDASWWREVYLRHRDLAESWSEAEEALRASDHLSRDLFYEALYFYLGATVEAATVSDNPIVRGLAMLDGRMGKRRLAATKLPKGEHPLVQLLFATRCEAEGIRHAGAA